MAKEKDWERKLEEEKYSGGNNFVRGIEEWKDWGVKIEQEGGTAGERDQEDGDLGGMDQYKSRGRRDQEGEDLGEED